MLLRKCWAKLLVSLNNRKTVRTVKKRGALVWMLCPPADVGVRKSSDLCPFGISLCVSDSRGIIAS